ncbi:unnamed protein product, partial [Symbiodinium sp. KB8]
MGQDANWLLGMGCWAAGPVHGHQPLSLRIDYTRAAFVAAYQQRFFDLPGLAAFEALAVLELLALSLEGPEIDVWAALEPLSAETVAIAGYLNYTELQNNTCHVVQVLADSTEPIVVFPESVQERSLVYPAPGWQERNCTLPAPASS